MNKNEQISVVVCMGSSCFARGNKQNLEYIESLIENGELNLKLELAGNRCEKKCTVGPNIKINNEMFNNVTREKLEQIFSKYLTKS